MVAGILAALFGLVLGIVARASQPAKEGVEPENATPGQVFFEKGTFRGGSDWGNKRTALLQGSGDITVTEAEINLWARTNLSPRKPSGPPAEGDKKKGSLVEIEPGIPNVRLKESSVQVQIPLDVTFMGSTVARNLIATGPVVNKSFQPRVTTLGCARLPIGLQDVFVGAILDSYTGTNHVQEMLDAWETLETVKVEDGKLVLVR